MTSLKPPTYPQGLGPLVVLTSGSSLTFYVYILEKVGLTSVGIDAEIRAQSLRELDKQGALFSSELVLRRSP